MQCPLPSTRTKGLSAILFRVYNYLSSSLFFFFLSSFLSFILFCIVLFYFCFILFYLLLMELLGDGGFKVISESRTVTKF